MISRYALFVLAALPVLAAAQEPLRTLSSPNNFVRSAAIAGDTLYVGGDFTAVGPPTGLAVVLDPSTGRPDLSQARVSGTVEVILPDGAGGWYVGGGFTFAGGDLRRNLARVLADGSLADGFAPDPRSDTPGVPGFVDAMALSADGQTLYIGGSFTSVGGQSRRDLAALDAQTGAVRAFRADVVPGVFRSVRDLLFVSYADGSGAALYVGGDFTVIGGSPRPGIAALDAETGSVLPWNPEPEADGEYYGAGLLRLGTPPAPGQPGTLYFASRADRLRGQPCPNGPAEVTLADPQTGDGGAPTGFCVDFGFADIVVTPGAIFAVDDYVNRGVIQRIDRTTGAVAPFFGGVPYGMTPGGLQSITFDPAGGSGGVLYVNTGRDGSRPVGRGQVVIGVDALTGQRVGPEIPVANERTGLGVVDIAVEPGGRLFVGGDDFASVGVGGEERRFLAGLDLTTGGLIPFGTDFVIFSSVEDVAVSPDERTLYFATFNGIGVADLTTGEIMTFPTGGGRAGLLGAEAPNDSTSGHVHRSARGGPVGMRVDGGPLAPFAAPARTAEHTARRGRARPRASAVALIATEDRLYSYPGGGVIAYDRDTAAEIWTTPVVGFAASPRAENLLLVEGGPPGALGDTLFLAGSILSVDGQPRDKFAALDAETGALLDWNVDPVNEPNGVAFELAALGPDANGAGGARIYLGGDGLFEIGGLPRENLAAADRTTGEVLGWAPAEPEFGSAMVAQPGPGGGVPGGVVYSQGVALDAETAALVPGWEVDTPDGGLGESILSERHGRVVFVGNFANALRGSGHARVIAVTPARPFFVAGEPGTGEVPQAAALTVAGANPARSASALSLSLPTSGAVTVALYDVLGRRVSVLHEGPLAAGVSRIAVNVSALPAGVYVARAVGDTFAASVTLTIVR